MVTRLETAKTNVATVVDRIKDGNDSVITIKGLEATARESLNRLSHDERRTLVKEMKGNPATFSETRQLLAGRASVLWSEIEAFGSEGYVYEMTDGFRTAYQAALNKYNAVLAEVKENPSDPTLLTELQRASNTVQLVLNADTNITKKIFETDSAIVGNYR